MRPGEITIRSSLYIFKYLFVEHDIVKLLEWIQGRGKRLLIRLDPIPESLPELLLRCNESG